MSHRGDYAKKKKEQTTEPCKPNPIFSNSLTSWNLIANENIPNHYHPLRSLETQWKHYTLVNSCLVKFLALIFCQYNIAPNESVGTAARVLFKPQACNSQLLFFASVTMKGAF